MGSPRRILHCSPLPHHQMCHPIHPQRLLVPAQHNRHTYQLLTPLYLLRQQHYAPLSVAWRTSAQQTTKLWKRLLCRLFVAVGMNHTVVLVAGRSSAEVIHRQLTVLVMVLGDSLRWILYRTVYAQLAFLVLRLFLMTL